MSASMAGVRSGAAGRVAPSPKLVQKARLMCLVGRSVAVATQQQQAQPQQQAPQQAGQHDWMQAVKKELKESASWAAAVLPFASAVAQSSGAGATAEIYAAVAKALDIYLLVLTLRVILTWFRNINWFSEPFATLRQFTDPFLNTFRGVLPSFGGIDVSPMIGFLLLNFVRNQLVHLSRTINQ